MGEDSNGIANKEKTLTVVLESALDFIIESYKEAKDDKLKHNRNSFKIIYRLDEKSEAKELNKENIHGIFDYIFNKIQQKKEEYCIWVKFGANEACEKVEYNIPVDYDKLSCIKSSIGKAEPIYDEKFVESIEHSFINKELKKNLIAGLDSFTNKLYDLAECNQFPTISDIDVCLKVYYKLLIDIMEGDFVKKRIIEKSFLQKLLNFDAMKLVGNDGCISLYSPIILNNLQKMYLGVIDFYKTLFDSLKTEPISIEMANMYRSILIAKVQRIFRCYLYDNQNGLKYLAIPPKPLGDCINNVIRINTKKLVDCNSFEGIGELRLAEKIVEAYENFPKGKGSLKVALIGDINHPFRNLKEYVEKKIGKSEENVKIEYNIYTKNIDLESKLRENGELNNITINYDVYDKILQSTEEMDEVLNENHVVFFLDCEGLYEELSVYDEKGIESSMQIYRFNPYNSYSNWADDPQNIFASNPLDNLYQNMVAYMATGRFGSLEKNPKKQVLEYIESKIEGLNAGEFKLVYVYVSDLKAFSNIYCREQYYMRVEQYNEKKIGIIRFSTLKEDPLENSTDNMIVLSAWQIIKHIALEDRADILNIIKNKIEDNLKVKIGIDEYNLHSMYIGLDYSKWKDSIKVYYNYKLSGEADEKEYEEFIKYFITNIFMQVFRKPKGSIYQQYCKNVIISFLYGDSKSIEDILFVHLLKNDKVNLENVIWNENDGKSDKVMRNRNSKLRFSNKRLYDLAMQCYGGITVNILEEFKVSQLFEEEGIAKQKYKDEILQACRNVDYIDSYMYTNCL